MPYRRQSSKPTQGIINRIGAQTPPEIAPSIREVLHPPLLRLLYNNKCRVREHNAVPFSQDERRGSGM